MQHVNEDEVVSPVPAEDAAKSDKAKLKHLAAINDYWADPSRREANRQIQRAQKRVSGVNQPYTITCSLEGWQLSCDSLGIGVEKLEELGYECCGVMTRKISSVLGDSLSDDPDKDGSCVFRKRWVEDGHHFVAERVLTFEYTQEVFRLPGNDDTPVLCYGVSFDGNQTEIFESIADAGRFVANGGFGVRHCMSRTAKTAISKAINGWQKTAYGHRWFRVFANNSAMMAAIVKGAQL